MKRSFIVLFFGIVCLSFVRDKPAYRIYDAEGKDLRYSRMVRNLEEADIIFFGELHDNPISHWLQLELTRDLFISHGDGLVLGAEMFESDNQLLLDEYLSGIITEEKFEEEEAPCIADPRVKAQGRLRLIGIGTSEERRIS